MSSYATLPTPNLGPVPIRPPVEPRQGEARRLSLRPHTALVVATDGGRAAGAALRVAARLASRDDAVVEALVVESPFPAAEEGVSIDGETLRDEPLPPTTDLGRVRQQLTCTQRARGWNLHVEFGSVAPTIAAAATCYGARLIVMGLSRHHPIRRALRSETPMRVLRHARVPVLAVSATARDLPRTAVVAVDFSPASLHAAREARDLLQTGGTLHLVHVGPEQTTNGRNGLRGWHAIYEAGVGVLLDKLAKSLDDGRVMVTPRIETGTIAEGVLRAAREVGADLIACGTHGYNAVERVILGSVSSRILRGAECSVLVAPAAGVLDAERPQ